jgi:hypothetical protein
MMTLSHLLSFFRRRRQGEISRNDQKGRGEIVRARLLAMALLETGGFETLLPPHPPKRVAGKRAPRLCVFNEPD